MRPLIAVLCALLVAGTCARAAGNTIPPRMLARLQSMVLAPGGYADETYDDGLPPTQKLRTAGLEGPTPSTVPGAKTITTAALRDLLVARQPALLLDVVDKALPRTLPGAYVLEGAGHGNALDDDVQQRLAKALAELTAGKPAPVVVFCQGPSSWLAYNVALRLVKLGATVLWYRGGHQAWFEARLPQLPATPASW